MSDITTRDLTRNQGTADRDTSAIFVFDNSYRDVTFLNNTGAEITLNGGEVLGTVTASGKLVILKSASTDGSETPRGIANVCGLTVADGAEAEISMCIGGDVVEDKIVLDGSDTLDTPSGGATIRDGITGASMGIRIVPSEELTGYDN